jgi:hypothetical protein
MLFSEEEDEDLFIIFEYLLNGAPRVKVQEYISCIRDKSDEEFVEEFRLPQF